MTHAGRARAGDVRRRVPALRQRRRARRRLYLLALAALLALLCFALWLYARSQSKAAEEANRLLEDERRRLATIVGVIDQLDRVLPHLKAVMRGHAGGVNAAAFSPDGTRLVTASDDGTAHVWEVETGVPLGKLLHSSPVGRVAFTPDGRLVTGTEDGKARVWDITDPGGLRVSGIKLKITPDRYAVPCPAAVRLIGSINVVGVSGTVRYRFARSDKADPGVERTLTFDAPGTREVSVVYRFGGPGFRNVSGAFRLEVLAPHPARSDDATFDVKCELPAHEAGAEAAPPPGSP